MRWLLPALFLLAFSLGCGPSGDSPRETSPSPATPAPTPEETPSPSPSPVSSPSPNVIRPASPSPSAPLYIALGDSLSAGIGASNLNATGFVPLVRQALGGEAGLLNLAHAGDTSRKLLDHGHVADAVAEIEKRSRDSDPDNNVILVTLEIGGNDLLRLYRDLVIPGICPTLAESLQKAECVEPLRQALDAFTPNLKEAVDRLQTADTNLPIVLITLYNPFSGRIQAFDPLAELALEGLPETPFPEGLNDLIRARALESGVILADVYPLFVGRAGEYISSDIVHPNDAGYRVMADAVLAAIGR